MDIKLPLVKKIKKGTPIQFVANSNMIAKLYEALNFFFKEITAEQVEKYKKEIQFLLEINQKKKQFSEEWMIHVTTLTIIVQQLEGAAEEQGLVYEEPAETTLKDLENVITTLTEDDSLLTDLSQLSPE
jgi:hypothetical protein